MHKITQIKRDMNFLIQEGASLKSIIPLLSTNGVFIAKECEFWDYKESFENDEVSLLKLVKRISAFHNSYGGYIIFGIKESIKDKQFEPVDFDTSVINLAQIREYLKNYLDGNIDVTYSEYLLTVNLKQYNLAALYIPKRGENENTVVKCIKNSKKFPPNNKMIFHENDVFYRRIDECKKVEYPYEWEFILSRRDQYNDNSKAKIVEIETMLPDKQLICPNFIGRDDVLSELWNWISEPFEYTKILAGDGGKGKTSIAYEFCLKIRDINLSIFERIIWMTAKRQQFLPFINQYSNERDVDFTSFKGFLIHLCDRWGLDENDFDENSISSMKKVLNKNISMFSSLIIVDDLDSLDPNEQSEVIEFCLKLGRENVKFLITTRSRRSFSEDLCIQIKGLNESDYKLLIEDYCSKYKIESFSQKNITSIYEATDGSPLLTQSIIRLIKHGTALNSALKEWKGQEGIDARNAALKREIDTLNSEEKRVLLCITLLDNCSLPELETISSLKTNKLRNALDGLNTLFLVEQPAITEGIPRYSVPTTVRLLVSNMRNELVKDSDKIVESIKNLKEGTPNQRIGNSKTIGLAITQALALLKTNDESTAIRTIQNELNRQPNNPDLLLAYGRILCEKNTPDYSQALQKFKIAYDNKQRKPLLFECWYHCEDENNSLYGKIDVCKKALELCENKPNNYKYKWNYRMSSLLSEQALTLKDKIKIDTLLESSHHLSLAMNNTPFKDECLERSVNLHHSIIDNLKNTKAISYIDSCQYVLMLIEHGDKSKNLFRYVKYFFKMAVQDYNQKTRVDNKLYQQIISVRNKFNKLIQETKHSISLE